jgi:uncharacterized protein with FMN-binding domain
MGNTKIIVLRSKEVLYTLLFFALFVLLLVLFFFMFLPSIKSEEASAGSYTPGVYNSQLSLNDTTLNIEVVVDENHINSVRLVNIDESVTTMYPLMEPAMESISEQLCNNVALEDVVLSDSSKYTQTMLLQAVEETLKKAAVTADNE